MVLEQRLGPCPETVSAGFRYKRKVEKGEYEMKCKDSYISIDMWAGRYVLFIVIIYNSTYIIWITVNSRP